MTRAKPNDNAQSLLCSEPGCFERWTSNFGRRYCSAHNPGLSGHNPTKRQSSLLAAPTLREVLPPFNERAERDGDSA